MINFPTTVFQNMHQFNENFEKAVSTLQEEWLGRNVRELGTTHEDFQPIMNLLNNNISLLTSINNMEEVSRFINTSYQIPVWINKNLHQDHVTLDNTIINWSLVILRLSKNSIPDSIDNLNSLKAVNETLFLDVLANWVNVEKIPLKKLEELKLSEKQLIQLAPRLNHLDFTDTKYSEDFIGQLFEKSEKVKSIIFEDSIISGSCFNFLKNTENLETIILNICKAFDQKLPDNLPSLKKLEIFWCGAFDQKLSDNLPSLQQLKISECVAFNQQLPNNLPSLQQLEISWCDAFDQKLPDNLLSLQQLKISSCEAFNQQLPDNLPSLQQLDVSWCKEFDQKLPDNLPSLKKLHIYCKKFNPFSHNLKTALLFSLFDLEQFEQIWGQLTPEKKQQKVQEVINAFDTIQAIFAKTPEKILNVAEAFKIPLESFKQAYPEEISYFTFINIDKERSLGGSDEEILTLFSSLKDQPNYLETLKIMLRSFPSLTSFILRNQKDELLKEIENLQISVAELPSETKWSLLPLLKADDIVQMIHLTSKEERAGWLQKELHFDRFSGSVVTVLKSIKEANIDGSTTESVENLTSTILELLQMIPFKTLAALTFDDQNLKTILAYLPFMNEQQMAVVIPALPQKVFIDYLDKQLLNTHPDKLMHATQLQKELYLEKRVIEHFVLSLKDRLTTFKQVMETNQTPEDEEKMEQDFNILHASITQQLNSIPKILNRTKDALLKGSPTEDFRHDVETFSKEISSMITWMGSEMIEINHRLDSKKEEIPEEYLDTISGEIMTDPYRDERSGTILDNKTWNKVNGENPFNRQPTTLVEDRNLKEKIQKYLADKELEKK